MVRAAESAGEPLTFCSGLCGGGEAASGVIAGLMPMAPVVAVMVASAVTTNCCSRLVTALVSGCTSNTPAMVNTVPRAKVSALATPLMFRVAPVWLAPFTCTPATLLALVWVGTSGFSYQSKPAVRPMEPSRYCSRMALESWNRPFRASTMVAVARGDRCAVRLASIGVRLLFSRARACR